MNSKLKKDSKEAGYMILLHTVQNIMLLCPLWFTTYKVIWSKLVIPALSIGIISIMILSSVFLMLFHKNKIFFLQIMERHLLIETVLVWTFEDEETALCRAKWSSILLPVLFLVSGGLQFLCYWINNKYCHPYRNKIYAKNRKYFQSHCKGQSFNIYTCNMFIKSGLGYWASMLMKGNKNKRVKRYLSLKLQLNHFNHIHSHHRHLKRHQNEHQHHLNNK